MRQRRNLSFTILDSEIQVMALRLYYSQDPVTLGLYFLISQLVIPLIHCYIVPWFCSVERLEGRHDQGSSEIKA